VAGQPTERLSRFPRSGLLYLNSVNQPLTAGRCYFAYRAPLAVCRDGPWFFDSDLSRMAHPLLTVGNSRLIPHPVWRGGVTPRPDPGTGQEIPVKSNAGILPFGPAVRSGSSCEGGLSTMRAASRPYLPLGTLASAPFCIADRREAAFPPRAPEPAQERAFYRCPGPLDGPSRGIKKNTEENLGQMLSLFFGEQQRTLFSRGFSLVRADFFLFPPSSRGDLQGP